MTNEERGRFQRIERNMEFIVQHQAEFDVNLRRIEQMHAALEEVVMKLAQSHSELVNSHKALADAAAESERRLTQSHERLEAAQAKLAAAQAETGERLDAFMAFFKKYLSGRNGGKQKN